MQGDVAFVEVRDELRAQTGSAEPGDACQKDRGDDRHRREADRRIEGGAVREGGPAHHGAFLLFDFSADQQRDRGRHEGQRKDQGRRQSQHDREGHWMEHLSFNAGEGKDRQVDDRDDDDAEDRGLDNFCRRLGRKIKAFVLRQQAA